MIYGLDGYTRHDVHYVWDGSGVTIEEGVEMAQYHIANVTTVAPKLVNRGQGKLHEYIY